MAVREMTERESRELLARGHVGHLACVHDNRPYVVPVSYAFDAEKLYVFSLTGQKIDWLRSNPNACLQVEESGENHRWKSVVAQGIYHELPDTTVYHNERLYAWSLLQKRSFWWEPGSSKPGTGSGEPEVPIFFNISIDQISGRELVAP
ncbi:pyridoxamine 5'-phosphate oxidase family protein [Rhizobium sp. LjRoot258]|uniref:pyridoxamine 5'-phosphate oxidase family protein n=1 Tax=Rhizobium sp. LjRoot258 TaxID=3342299 RepID=UPI003ECF280E